MLSCHECNKNGNKGVLFPLADPKKRAHHHGNDISGETPLLLHPAKEDPAPHLLFREYWAIGVTERGKATVDDILHLNRPYLLTKRKEKLDDITELNTIVALESELEASEASF